MFTHSFLGARSFDQHEVVVEVIGDPLQVLQGHACLPAEKFGELALVDTEVLPEPVRRYPFPIEDFFQAIPHHGVDHNKCL